MFLSSNIRQDSTIKKMIVCIWLNFILLECFHFILMPKYSSLQELSNGMFYKGIASTITHIGPQRVTPLGALLFIISLVYFTLWTSKFGYVLSRSTATEGAEGKS